MALVPQKVNRFRLYSMGHFYLSSLQQGLQATHITGKLIAKYPENTEQRLMLREWAQTEMDVKLLNGGNSKDLQGWVELFAYFENEGMNLPYAHFNETEENLGGALTAIGVLVPQEIYAHPAFNELHLTMDDLLTKYPNLPQWQLHLIYSLRSCQLAR